MNCEFATQAADELASHASDLQQAAGYDRTLSGYLEDIVRCTGLTAGCAEANSVASQYREIERVAEQIVAGPAGYSRNADAFAASSQDVVLAAATANSVMGNPAAFAAMQRQAVDAIADLNVPALGAASVFQREYEKFSRRTSFATVLAALNETAHSQAVATTQDFYAPQKQWFPEAAGVTAARDFADRWKLDTAASLQPAANFAAYAGLAAQAMVGDISGLGLVQAAHEAAVNMTGHRTRARDVVLRSACT